MPIGRLVLGHVAIRIVGEELGKDDFVRIRAADRERITDHGPLRLAVQAENLAQVVDQTGQDEPARMAVAANGFGRLQAVLDLREVGIGVAIVDRAC